MKFEDHVKECVQRLGEGFPEVHLWLDELAFLKKPDGTYFDMAHRRHRHNLEGVEAVRRKWGPRAARAAEIHILSDEGKIISQKKMLEHYPAEDSHRCG